MPGDAYLSNYDYGAGFGYAPTGSLQTMVTPGYGSSGYGPGGSTHHTSFVVWLAVFTLASVAILHGLRFAGYSFIYKR